MGTVFAFNLDNNFWQSEIPPPRVCLVPPRIVKSVQPLDKLMDPTRIKLACFESQLPFVTGSRMVGECNILLLIFCCAPYTVLFPQRIEGNLR